jgi:EAL domain-containing protein (putative c-di-GMP-specific phosphodiesterase class I)
MKFADIAMYRAKELGYNRCVFFDPNFSEPIRKKSEIEALLRQADIEKDFELHFQPQFSLPEMKLIGAEALIRWNCGANGPIYPNEFIPIAEEIGYITKIGNWVMNEVYSRSSEWNSKYACNIRVGMNVSPQQLENDAFTDEFKRLCGKDKSFSGLVDVEITENSVLLEGESVQKVFKLLRDCGATISIDDFGTGYASLNYLRKFTFDRIKIAKTLVDSITENDNDRQIVNAIILLAKSIGIRTIAEGVEEEEQLAVLKRLGSEQVQGFLLGRPVPAAAFEETYLKQAGQKINLVSCL